MVHGKLQALMRMAKYALFYHLIAFVANEIWLQIYTFKNIRFAAPPVGELRWALPAEPEHNATLQDGSYGPVCVQAPLKGVDLVGPGDESAIGAAANQLFGGLTSLKPSPPSSEGMTNPDLYPRTSLTNIKTVSSWTYMSLPKLSMIRHFASQSYIGSMEGPIYLGRKTRLSPYFILALG